MRTKHLNDALFFVEKVYSMIVKIRQIKEVFVYKKSRSVSAFFLYNINLNALNTS